MRRSEKIGTGVTIFLALAIVILPPEARPLVIVLTVISALYTLGQVFFGKDSNAEEIEPDVLLQLDRRRPEGDDTREIVPFTLSSSSSAVHIEIDPISTGDYPNGDYVRDDIPVRPILASQTMYFSEVPELHATAPVPVVPQYEPQFSQLLRALSTPSSGFGLWRFIERFYDSLEYQKTIICNRQSAKRRAMPRLQPLGERQFPFQSK
jgi:hypothetical protein